MHPQYTISKGNGEQIHTLYACIYIHRYYTYGEYIFSVGIVSMIYTMYMLVLVCMHSHKDSGNPRKLHLAARIYILHIHAILQKGGRLSLSSAIGGEGGLYM